MVEWGEGYAPLLGPNGCFRRCARRGLMSDFGWLADGQVLEMKAEIVDTG